MERSTKLKVLFVLCSALLVVYGKEGKVSIDEFKAGADVSLTYPEDCDAQSFAVDNPSILGGGRSLQYGTKAIANNYFVVCDEKDSCEVSSTFSDGEWTTIATSVQGDCQLSATYAGEFIYYGLNGGDGFRLTSGGADSFRVITTVTGNIVQIYINIVGIPVVTLDAPIGTNEFVIPFHFTDYSYYYYDLVYEITLGVRFNQSASISISKF